MTATANEDQRARLIQEHLALQQQFNDYVRQNGFDSAAFYSPEPGSFFDTYRKRWEELSLLITKQAAK